MLHQLQSVYKHSICKVCEEAAIKIYQIEFWWTKKAVKLMLIPSFMKIFLLKLKIWQLLLHRKIVRNPTRTALTCSCPRYKIRWSRSRVFKTCPKLKLKRFSKRPSNRFSSPNCLCLQNQIHISRRQDICRQWACNQCQV